MGVEEKSVEERVFYEQPGNEKFMATEPENKTLSRQSKIAMFAVMK